MAYPARWGPSRRNEPIPMPPPEDSDGPTTSATSPTPTVIAAHSGSSAAGIPARNDPRNDQSQSPVSRPGAYHIGRRNTRQQEPDVLAETIPHAFDEPIPEANPMRTRFQRILNKKFQR